MATQHSYGKTVTSGLVLYLNAADRNSYPGTGTTWTDLSGNGNTGTLTNGPTYNGANGGSIVFDGTNDQVSISNSSTFNNTSNKTVEMWINVGSIGANFCTILTNRGAGDQNTNLSIHIDNRKLVRVWNPSGTDEMVLIYGMGNGTTPYYAYSKNKCGITNGDSIWHHIVGITNVSQNTVSLYYDSLLLHSASLTGTPATPNVALRLGTGYSSGLFDYPTNCKISNFKVYNRVLTDAEILQNYDASKSRFGLT